MRIFMLFCQSLIYGLPQALSASPGHPFSNQHNASHCKNVLKSETRVPLNIVGVWKPLTIAPNPLRLPEFV